MSANSPNLRTLVVALLYSAGAHGIMTLNDFKSVRGDRRMGIASLPVQLGVEAAAIIACFIMAVPQLIVVLLLFVWGHPYHATVVALLWLAQLALMDPFLEQPVRRAEWYSATGVSLYVLGMLVTAVALRQVLGA
jgi:chlorophyll synthase